MKKKQAIRKSNTNAMSRFKDLHQAVEQQLKLKAEVGIREGLKIDHSLLKEWLPNCLSSDETLRSEVIKYLTYLSIY